MKDSQPKCLTCFETLHADYCDACGRVIGVNQGHLTHGSQFWHATEACFSCHECHVSLKEKPFLPRDGKLYCSVSCSEANERRHRPSRGSPPCKGLPPSGRCPDGKLESTKADNNNRTNSSQRSVNGKEMSKENERESPTDGDADNVNVKVAARHEVVSRGVQAPLSGSGTLYENDFPTFYTKRMENSVSKKLDVASNAKEDCFTDSEKLERASTSRLDQGSRETSTGSSDSPSHGIRMADYMLSPENRSRNRPDQNYRDRKNQRKKRHQRATVSLDQLSAGSIPTVSPAPVASIVDRTSSCLPGDDRNTAGDHHVAAFEAPHPEPPPPHFVGRDRSHGIQPPREHTSRADVDQGDPRRRPASAFPHRLRSVPDLVLQQRYDMHARKYTSANQPQPDVSGGEQFPERRMRDPRSNDIRSDHFHRKPVHRSNNGSDVICRDPVSRFKQWIR